MKTKSGFARNFSYAGAAAALAATALWASGANAQSSLMNSQHGAVLAAYGAASDRDAAATNDPAAMELPARLRRQVVNYPTSEAPGTIIVDTPNTYLYFVLTGGKAIRYGIGVGREGFTWAGVRTIERKQEWPDWIPPTEMLERQPYLPRFMAGGPGNPLGARAMYLSGSVYRIHGTNAPSTIGERVSSGCIRMLNEDAIDLYNHATIGTKVVVMPIEQNRVVTSARPGATPPRLHAASMQSRASNLY